MKKAFALLLTLMLIISAVPLGAFAFTVSAEEAIIHTEDFLTFEVSNGEATITGCNVSIGGDIVIPDTLGGYPVTNIASNAFYNYSFITSVTIPNSVTSIGECAFANCSDLANITLPDSIVNLDGSAFVYTEYYNNQNNWENGILYIGKYLICAKNTLMGECVVKDDTLLIAKGAFEYCGNLISITIPDSVKIIGSFAFSNCNSLENVSLPDSIVNISTGAFRYTKYYDDESNWENGVLYIGKYLISAKSDVTGEYKIKDGTRLIADYAFEGCSNITNVIIPNGVISIGYRVFSYCSNLLSVSIPDSVTNIGEGAFMHCSNLKSAIIPVGVTNINDEVFSWCNNIESVTIPDGVISIGDAAFSFCNSLASITIPSNVKNIGDNAFESCHRLTNINIPKDVIKIGHLAFSYCENLTEINVDERNYNYCSIDGVLFDRQINTLIQYPRNNESKTYDIPDGVKNIGDEAFYYCKNIIDITIPDSVVKIGDSAFSHCNAQNISIGNNVIEIGDWAFEACKIKSLVIPDSVQKIGTMAFSYLFLENIYIGSGVTNLDNNGAGVIIVGESDSTDSIGCFVGCSGILTIEVSKENKFYRAIDNVLFSKDMTKLLKYPNGSKNDSYIVPSGVEEIGESAFDCSYGLTSVTIPNSVTTIDSGAFEECDSLISIVIPESVTRIGSSAFAWCDNLANIIVPDTIESIGRWAFYCTAYYEDDENWGNDVLYLGNHLINSMTSLTGDYAVKENTKTIADGAFENCLNLIGISMPDSVISIGYMSFYNCSSLTNIIIPNGVKNIGAWAFCNCSNLTNIKIPSSVINVGQKAFYNCNNLDNVYIDDITAWCNISFDFYYNDYGYASTHPLCYADNLYLNGELITDVVIPEGIQSITSYAFNCKSITSVTLPSSVQSIGDWAFGGDKINVYITDLSAWCNIDFMGENSGPLGWNDTLYLNGEIISGEIELSNDVLKIPDYTFANSNLTNIKIPSSVESIGNYAFKECDSLKSIIIPSGVSIIGDYAFYSCDSLLYVIFNNTITGMGDSILMDCYNLWHVLYTGTQEEWNLIKISTFYNDILMETPKHYDASENEIGYLVEQHPTCANDGVGKYTCSACDSVKTTYLSAFGHTKEVIETISPTCTADGYTVYKCLYCGETFNADWVYSTGHTKGNVIESVNPSCTQEGYTRYNCSVCGTTYTTDWVWAQGHTKGEIVSVVDPTCEENGYTIYSCSVCDLTFTSDWIYSDGHLQGTIIEIVEATCTKDGYTKYQCSSCDKEFIDNRTYAFGHNGEAINSVGATCIEKGYTEFLCDLCGENYNSDFTSPFGHTFDNDICVNCNKSKEECIESSHNYEENCDETWVINKPHADYITVTFSSSTEVEEGYDYIYILDANDNLVGVYTGIELASRTIMVQGNVVKIRLVSDFMVNYYGFAVSNIISYISFTANNIEISIPENAFSSSVELKAKEIDITNIIDILPEKFDTKNALVYDIYFEKDGQKVQPQGDATVYIPVPEDKEGENYMVYHIDEDGTPTDMNAVYQDGYMVFNTDHFSYYALVEKALNYLKGDINGDTTINNRDLALLMQFLNGWEVEVNEQAGDVNADGQVNNRDYAILMQYVNGWDVKL